jgi:hypothetical protein
MHQRWPVASKKAIEEVKRIGRRAENIARRLARRANAEYTERLSRALDSAASGLGSATNGPESVRRYVESAGARFASSSTSALRGILETHTGQLTGLGRRLGRVLAPGGDRAPAGLSDLQRDGSEKLASSALQFAGELFPNSLGPRMAETLQANAVERFMTRNEVRKMARDIVAGRFPARDVPGTFKGTPAQYFASVARTNETTANAYGMLTTLSELNVETYEIVAVLDDRTTDVCRFLNGRRFAVADGLRDIQAMIDAPDPDAFRRASSFASLDEAESAVNRGTAGVRFPPYHINCRSVAVPVL